MSEGKEAITVLHVGYCDGSGVNLAVLACHLHALVGSEAVAIDIAKYIYIGLTIECSSNLTSCWIERHGKCVSSRLDVVDVVIAIRISHIPAVVSNNAECHISFKSGGL